MSKNDLENSLKIFLCCVGTVVGAGFASGQEIMSYFVRYEGRGAVGICVCAVLFFLYVYFVLKKIFLYNIAEFTHLFSGILNDKLAKIVQYICYGFMGATFVVMVSGSGAAAGEMWGRQTAGIVFMVVFCFAVFLKGAKGFVAVNVFMTPVIITGVAAVVIADAFRGAPVFSSFFKATDNFIASTVLYVSYNTITLPALLLPLKEKITSERVVRMASLFSGAAILALGLCLWYTLNAHRSELSGVQVPMLYIAQAEGSVFEHLYGAVLYMAMITTAVSSGFAFLSFVKEKTRIPYRALATALCALSIPLGYIGFAELVGKLYRFFGVLGALVMGAIFSEGIGRVVKKR